MRLGSGKRPGRRTAAGVVSLLVALLRGPAPCGPADAAEWHVDNVAGDDANPGDGARPFRSLARASSELKAGDTLHLARTALPYREGFDLVDLAGTEAAPIVIDGHFAVLSGVDPVDPAEWEDRGGGLWRRPTDLAPHQSPRFFVLFDGKQERMGVFGKRKRTPLPPPEAIEPRQWTYAEGEKALYLRLPIGEAPGPRLSLPRHPPGYAPSGVALSGRCAHIVVRRLVVEHFLNDGLNIHGECVGIRFETIISRGHGDDGLSAHGTCEITAENLIIHDNPGGVAHIGQARAVHRNLWIHDSLGVDVSLRNPDNLFENLVVDARSTRGVFASPAEGRTAFANLVFANADFRAGRDGVPFQIDGKEARLENVRLSGFAPVVLSTRLDETFDDAATRDLPGRLRALFPEGDQP